MALTQGTVKALKPKSKPYTASDGGGLFLRIHPTGRLMRYYQFMFNKKRVRMNIGTYPEFTLAEARDAQNGFARGVVRGINPKAAIEPGAEETEMLLRPFAERFYRDVMEPEVKRPEQF